MKSISRNLAVLSFLLLAAGCKTQSPPAGTAEGYGGIALVVQVLDETPNTTIFQGRDVLVQSTSYPGLEEWEREWREAKKNGRPLPEPKYFPGITHVRRYLDGGDKADASFGERGVLSLPERSEIVTLPNGDIVAFNRTLISTINEFPDRYSLGVERFSKDGHALGTFADPVHDLPAHVDGAGQTLTLLAGDEIKPRVDAQGHIYLIAMPTAPSGTLLPIGDPSLLYSALVFRYDAAGKIDATYGGGGFAKIPRARCDLATQVRAPIAILRDGRARLGCSNSWLGLAADGKIDTGFGTAGELTAYPESNRAIFQEDGKTVFYGQTWIARVNVDGSDDESFGKNGSVSIPEVTIPVVVAMPGGRLLQTEQRIFGTIGYNQTGLIGPTSVAITRYGVDGGDEGLVVDHVTPNRNEMLTSLDVGADGTIAVLARSVQLDEQGWPVAQGFTMKTIAP